MYFPYGSGIPPCRFCPWIWQFSTCFPGRMLSHVVASSLLRLLLFQSLHEPVRLLGGTLKGFPIPNEGSPCQRCGEEVLKVVVAYFLKCKKVAVHHVVVGREHHPPVLCYGIPRGTPPALW